jgi:hypothetical protein
LLIPSRGTERIVRYLIVLCLWEFAIERYDLRPKDNDITWPKQVRDGLSFTGTASVSLLCVLLVQSFAVTGLSPARSFEHLPKVVPLAAIDSLSTSVRVFVLNLPEIPSSMSNVTRFLEGIQDATQNRTFDVTTSYGDVETGVIFNVAEVSNWGFYRNIVLSGDNFVLINSHGSYLPVPKGYSPEQWFDQILGAISNRYGTWVHTAGSPFNQAWIEGTGPIIQSPSLFPKLASFAKWPAMVTRNPLTTSVHATTHFYSISWPSPNANTTSWNNAYYGYNVRTTAPSNYSLAVPVGLLEAGYRGFYAAIESSTVYYSGVVARVNGTTAGRYGLYVHFVPGTFGSENIFPSGVDTDYGRGLISSLMALEWQIVETSANIQLARETISSAENMGRTDGLDQSRQSLSAAESEFKSGQDLAAWLDASIAQTYANSARTPWWVDAWPYIALVGGIVGFSMIAALGAIVPGILGATVGRLGYRRGLIERISQYVKNRSSRRRERDPNEP